MNKKQRIGTFIYSTIILVSFFLHNPMLGYNKTYKNYYYSPSFLKWESRGAMVKWLEPVGNELIFILVGSVIFLLWFRLIAANDRGDN